MNYLAHAYLSFNDKDVLLGNMISDFVKGKQQFDFDPSVRQGIQLHRAIDTFTDEHPATKAAKEYFRKDYRLYSGAFVDVLYDHFLANDEQEFPHESDLMKFSHRSYAMLETQQHIMPLVFQQMFPYMQRQNWFYNYRNAEGIRSSFGGLKRRAAYIESTERAFEIFMEHYDRFEELYEYFFKDVKLFAIHHLATMHKH